MNEAQIFIIMLTITLSFMKKKRFQKQMRLKINDIDVFRTITTRKNIQYRIYRVRDRTSCNQKNELLKMIHDTRVELQKNDKMIIYNNDVNDY